MEVNTAHRCEMFTGIIERQGQIVSLTPTGAGRRLVVRAPGFWDDTGPGASVAVDGVCLTVARADGQTAEFDVVGETLARTTLGRARAGVQVNLEKSLRPDSRLDGHFVQGHVDGVGEIVRVEQKPHESKWWFKAPESVRKYIIPKGSIAIDGISLTIVDVTADAFSVVLIPTTLKITTLGSKRAGDSVNLEAT